MSELAGWTRSRLSDIATIVMGQAPSSYYVRQDGIGKSFIQGSAEFGSVSPKTGLTCVKPPRLCRPTDLLISVRAPVGEINIADKEYAIGRGLAAVRFFGVTPALGSHLLRFAASRLRRVAQGSTFDAIGNAELGDLEIYFPSNPRERRRITDILDVLDKRIDAEGRVLEKLAFVRDAVLLRELRQIEGCRSVRLEEIAAVERGRFVARPRNDPRFYGGAYPFIQTGDVARGSGKVIYDATQSLNEDGRRMSREFPAGTIAVTIAANIGETSILGRPMCFPDSVVGVVVSPGVSMRFIELCIRQLKPILESRAPQSAQKNINLQDLRPLEIPLPSGDVQMSIERLWTEAERLISEASQGVHK